MNLCDSLWCIGFTEGAADIKTAIYHREITEGHRKQPESTAGKYGEKESKEKY